MLKELLIPISLFALVFVGLAIRLLLMKSSRYRRFCNNVDLETGQQVICNCNGEPDTTCRNV